MSRNRIKQTWLAGACALALAGTAFAQARDFDVPQGELQAALDAYARQSGLQLIYRVEDVRGVRTPGARGVLQAEEALQRILAATGFSVRRDASGALALVKGAVQGTAGGAAYALDIAPQDLGAALRELGRVTGERILFEEAQVRGRTSLPLQGTFTAEEALRALLRDSGLRGQRNPEGALQVDAADERGVLPAGARGAARADGAVELDAVVVTANLREQRLVDVPMSISALSQSDVDRRGIQNLLDLSRAVPGMVVTESGPGQNRIFLRGVANGNSGTPLTGVYVDDIPVSTTSATQLDLRLLDLERVEVLRGPQGTLYGQGSAGGTVRFITQAPDLQAGHASGNAAFSAYATRYGDPSQEFTGTVNVPLVDDVLGMRVSATAGHYGGWIDQPDAGRRDINDQNLRNVNVKMLFKPSERLALRATAILHRNDGDGITASADEHHVIRYPNGDPQAQQFFRDDYDIYNLTASYDFDGVRLLSSTSNLRSDIANAGLALMIPGLEAFNVDVQTYDSFSQEVRLSSNGDSRANWVFGGFYNDQTVDRLLMLELYSDGEYLGSSPVPTLENSESWSVFGDVSYALTERLDVGAGLRYFRDRRDRPEEGLSGTFTSVDPRLYLSFDLSDAAKLYANVAKGFRSGGFTGDAVHQAYDPEKVWSYEIGAKGAAKHLRWELAAFFSRYQGYQAFVIQDNFLGGITNAGDAEIKGIDWSLAYDVTEHLSLQAGGNFTDTELVKVLPGAASNLEGDRLDFVPDYTLSLSAEYRFEWNAATPGFFRVDYNRIGKSTGTDRGYGFVEVPTDVLDFLNARVGLERERWGAELFAQNLLDENGQQDASAIFGFGSHPRPRTIGLRVSVFF